MEIKAIQDNILCTDGDFGDQTTEAGLIIKSTLGKESGITPRWFKVHAVGPEIDWIQPGQWIYVEYGRWTEGFKVGELKLWKVEPKACMLVSDDAPENHLNIADTHGDVFNKTRD